LFLLLFGSFWIGYYPFCLFLVLFPVVLGSCTEFLVYCNDLKHFLSVFFL
jgi:hypothetical protein